MDEKKYAKYVNQKNKFIQIVGRTECEWIE